MEDTVSKMQKILEDTRNLCDEYSSIILSLTDAEKSLIEFKNKIEKILINVNSLKRSKSIEDAATTLVLMQNYKRPKL